MKRYEPESIGDVLRNVLHETSLQNRMDELKAAELWPRIVGSEIAASCGKPGVKKGVMTIGVPNPSLRNELHMNRSHLCRIINTNMGKNVITDIKFTS